MRNKILEDLRLHDIQYPHEQNIMYRYTPTEVQVRRILSNSQMIISLIRHISLSKEIIYVYIRVFCMSNNTVILSKEQTPI